MKSWRSFLFLCAVGVLLALSHLWILHQPQHLLLRSQPLLPLSRAQIEALQALPTVHIRFYVRQNRPARRALQQMIAPLAALIPLQIEWINPDLDPIRAQQDGIQAEGQAYLSSGEHGARIELPSLSRIVQTLLAFQARESDFILHLQGHGERDFLSDSPGSWQALYRMILTSDGKALAWTQQETQDLPDNIATIVIADPQEALPAAHQKQLQEALQRGVNMIYSSDTLKPYLPEFIKEITGLDNLPGRMVSLRASELGLDHPEMMVIEHLGDTAITRDLKQVVLLPTSLAFSANQTSTWQRDVLFWSDERSWAEREVLREGLNIHREEEEPRGPLPLGYVLTRPHPQDAQRQQYLIVLGDSDSASAPYFTMAGNTAWWQQLFRVLGAQDTVLWQKPVLKDAFIHIEESALQQLAWLLFALPLFSLLLLLRRQT